MSEWNIRPYREGDTPAMAATVTAGFRADGVPVITSVDEIEVDFHRMGVDLPNGVLVVDGPRPEGLPEDVLPGYALLGVREDDALDERTYSFRIAVHPAARPLGLERELVHRLVAMARAHAAKPDLAPRKTVRV